MSLAPRSGDYRVALLSDARALGVVHRCQRGPRRYPACIDLNFIAAGIGVVVAGARGRLNLAHGDGSAERVVTAMPQAVRGSGGDQGVIHGQRKRSW